MDILMTAGMADRLREKLNNIGIHVIMTQETGPDDFINCRCRATPLHKAVFKLKPQRLSLQLAGLYNALLILITREN